MIDDNWDLIKGDAAHAIEVLNYSNQVNVIDALVYLYMHHYVGPTGGCTQPPDIAVLKEFHRTATLFLLAQPGEFRREDEYVVVQSSDGVVVHRPPNHPDMIPSLSGFFDILASRWETSSPQELGAFALWAINWVHPFKNGNGRTARAFCYACLSLKLGFVLPGSPTVIDLIMQDRDRYQRALKVADNSYEKSGNPDLTPMIAFVEKLLVKQLSNIGAA